MFPGWHLYDSKKKSSELEVKVRRLELQAEQAELNQLEDLLLERQHVFCSRLSLHSRRRPLEHAILQKAAKLEPQIPGVKADVERIFAEDRSCGATLTYLMTGDKTRNGALMWNLLKEWRSRLEKPSQQE